MDQQGLKEKIEVVLKMDEEQQKSGININLRDIIEVIIKGKWILAVIVIISLIFSTLIVPFTSVSSGSAKAIIAFNFDGIEKGLDPYGKNFDVSKIKAPVVLDKVVQTLGLSKYNITSSALNENIEIVPMLPGDITQKIADLEAAKKLNVQNLQDFTYYPNNYTINLNIPSSYNLSSSEAQNVLDEVIKQYQQYFYDQYSDKSVLANALGPINYDNYDYPEISTVINSQIDIIKNYLDSKSTEIGAQDFRAKSTGLSFSDIREAVNVISDVDVSSMDSLINSNNLTKDKVSLINLYEYKIKQLNLESAKKQDEASTLNSAISKYKKDKNVVVIPGLAQDQNANGTIEVGQKDPYYNDLSKRASDAKTAATNSSHDAQFYKAELVRLKNDHVSASEKKIAEKSLLELLPKVKTKLENWVKLTNSTVSEYFQTEKYNGAIKSLSPAVYTSTTKSNMTIHLFAGILIGVIIGLGVLAFMEYWRRSGKDNVKAEA